MDVGMAGIVVIDRDPIEPGAEIGFDLAHEVAGIGREVGEVRGVLGRDDEPELVAIIRAALDKGRTVGAILGRRIELAAFAVARGAVALDVAQMGGGPSILARALNVAGPDYDAALTGRVVPPAARQGTGANEGRAASALQARRARPRRLAALGGRRDSRARWR